MRPIDADKLKKCVLKWLPKDPCGIEEKEMPFETDICVSMLMEIDDQPTIQPVQPNTGKWISADAIFGGVPFYCSECGESTLDTVMGKPRWNFCPMCGAKMGVTE